MSSYNELIKNFERIRAYMREFYVYGIKSREDYKGKSGRTYDDERRRLESWLGEHMSFVRTPEGKNMFISIDSRAQDHNPLYNAWRAKSFTDGDITLHFILFDILHSPEIEFSAGELLARIFSDYLADFDEPMSLDESTLRKKLKEYIELGIIASRKEGRRVLYSRSRDSISTLDTDALHFFSEVMPCGVVGAFLLDKTEHEEHPFDFKHHYITGALDMGVVATLFSAMHKKCAITISNMSRRRDEPRKNRVVPLRIFISVQNGRQHLLAYQPDFDCIKSFRIDYLSGVKLEEPEPRFDELRARLDRMQPKMWGVNTRGRRYNEERTEHVEFTVGIEPGEEHILRRLERERRVGRVEQVGDGEYRFSADVYDTVELLPWIWSFICRIRSLSFTNRNAERQFLDDLGAMYSLYGLSGGGAE